MIRHFPAFFRTFDAQYFSSFLLARVSNDNHQLDNRSHEVYLMLVADTVHDEARQDGYQR